MSKRKAKTACMKWTPAMDDKLIDSYFHEHNMGRRVNGAFTSQALANITANLKQQFKNKPIHKEKVRDRMKYIKAKFKKCNELFNGGMSGFDWDSMKSMWTATPTPQVWKTLIEVKPESERWMGTPTPYYEKMVIMFGNGNATGELTSKETRKNISSSAGSCLDSVDNIEKTVSQNDDVVALHTKEEMDNAAQATEKSFETFLKAHGGFDLSKGKFEISKRDIWNLVDGFGFQGKTRRSAYIFLIKNPDMLDAVLSVPITEQKEVLIDLLA